MNKYETKAKPLRTLAQNPDPQVLANTLTKNTAGLHEALPNISQSLKTLGAKTLTYLHSKMPQSSNSMIGDADYEAPKAQQREWLDLHDIVNDPVSALDHVRHGTFTSQHLDALQNVHPELLNEMRQKVMENMDPDKVKKLPSSTKLSLGTFLGSPITQSQTPSAVLANQIGLQQTKGMPQQGSPKSTVGGLDKLQFGERVKTETQDDETEEM